MQKLLLTISMFLISTSSGYALDENKAQELKSHHSNELATTEQNSIDDDDQHTIAKKWTETEKSIQDNKEKTKNPLMQPKGSENEREPGLPESEQYLSKEEINFLEQDKLLKKEFLNDSEKKYFPQINLNLSLGHPRHSIRPMFLVPLTQTPVNLTYFHTIGVINSNPSYEANIAFGFRRLSSEYIIGTYAYYDISLTEHNNKVHQFTLGAEFITEYFETRFNVYIPFKTKFFISTDHFERAEYDGTNTSITSMGDSRYEVVRPGIDLELGGNINKNNKYSCFLKGFFYYSADFKNILGVQLRGAYHFNRLINLNIRTGYDNNRKFAGYVGINFIWKFGDNRLNQLTTLEHKMTQMPQRDIDIIATVDDYHDEEFNIANVEGFTPVISSNDKSSGNAVFASISALNQSETSDPVSNVMHVNALHNIIGVKTMTNSELNDISLSDLSLHKLHITGAISECIGNKNDSRRQIQELLLRQDNQTLVNSKRAKLNKDLTTVSNAAVKALNEINSKLQTGISDSNTSMSNIQDIIDSIKKG